jgi:hypothetical protein
MPYVGAFDPADSTEVDAYSIDFTKRMVSGDTIVSASASLSVLQGVDANPSAHVAGSVAISGYVVTQVLSTLLPGVTYELTITVTTNAGRILTAFGSVICKGPSL